jgi:5'-3' exonuclease
VHLLAVDGNSLAHRVWHAVTGSDDEVGEFVAAGVIGLVATVWPLGPYDGLVVAFDHVDNRRKQEHPHYKAGRETHPDLHERLLDLAQRLAALGVPTVTEPGLEADDLLAALAAGATVRGWRTDVLSGDRDLTALVDSSRVRLLRPRGTMADLLVTTPAVVHAEYGVTPDQYHDFAALRGDPSDGLPGVDGIGPKAAAALLAEHGSLDEIYANLCYLPTKHERALRSGRERAFHNRMLMTPLAPTVDVDEVLDRGARLDLDTVVTLLEDMGVDDPSLARAARRLVWAQERSVSPLPNDVPLPDAPLPDDHHHDGPGEPAPDAGPGARGADEPQAEGGVPHAGATPPVFVDEPDDAEQAALFG